MLERIEPLPTDGHHGSVEKCHGLRWRQAGSQTCLGPDLLGFLKGHGSPRCGGEDDMEVSEKIKKILILFSFAPFLSIGHMASIRGWGMSPLRRRLKRMESKEVGWVASVPHTLGGRKSAARYHLTDNGVTQLARTLGMSVPKIMNRPGTTGYGLATCHRLIDICTAVYETAATIARCYECSDARCNESPDARCSKSPDLRIHLFGAGPLDAVLRVRDSPYSLGCDRIPACPVAQVFREEDTRVCEGRTVAAVGPAGGIPRRFGGPHRRPSRRSQLRRSWP